MTDQVRRSSRSVCANLAEAWQKRRYPQAFVAKLSDSASEAAETIVWLEFGVRFGYMKIERAEALTGEYEIAIAQLVRMMQHPEHWVISK